MQKFHLMKIEEICHFDENGHLIWKEENIPNILHQDGQEFILQGMFNSSFGIVPPTYYYLGLDARLVLSSTDTLANLIAEPTTNGYARQPVSSYNGFTVTLGDDGKFKAVSGSVVFSASGGSWGPVRDLFLTDIISGTNGYLISSAQLSRPRTVNSGQSLSMRISMALGNC